MIVRQVAMAVLLTVLAQTGLAQRLVLSNPLGVDRSEEVIEVPLQQILDHLHLSQAQASSLIAEDATTKQRVESQLYGDRQDNVPDRLLLLVHLSARAKQKIAFHVDPHATELPALVFGRDAPERKDDFAWENQYVSYRVYGPALQATGKITSGIDVWSKRVPNFVIDTFYKRDQEGSRTHNPTLSYHKDNGQGLDSYYVGPTRGCGGTAVFSDGKLYVSKNYTHLRQLSIGPLRFAFELTYARWDSPAGSVNETKRITLDAGTHLNKIESTYSFTGSKTMELAAGIAVHEGAQAEFPVAGRIASVWDTPQDPTAGPIATGLIAGSHQNAKTLATAGHGLMIFSRHSGEPFTYYAGSGWSKADMPTNEAWKAYLALQSSQLEHPISMNWER